ncbi:MAG: hypothetical protein NC301_03825 [Bacteroides sp.]|nr:hypothetical protein [Bacteroides sp.]MCM1378683.1 hypothetical protein [Bacteroides sp.]MCM1444956.1 hypothetical protein [Prevotella sp.]
MRTISSILTLIILMIFGCSKENEPTVSDRVVEEQTEVSQPIDLESQVRDVTTVTTTYYDYFYHFRVKSLYKGNIVYGIQHTKTMLSMGSEQLGEYFVDYSIGDTAFVEIDIPYWTYFSKVDVNPERYFLLEDAYAASDYNFVDYYEKLVTDTYQPRVIAIVDSTLEITF